MRFKNARTGNIIAVTNAETIAMLKAQPNTYIPLESAKTPEKTAAIKPEKPAKADKAKSK